MSIKVEKHCGNLRGSSFGDICFSYNKPLETQDLKRKGRKLSISCGTYNSTGVNTIVNLSGSEINRLKKLLKAVGEIN